MSRLVLAAAFLPLGWDKLMGEPHVFVDADAQVLRTLGIAGGEIASIEGWETHFVLARPDDEPPATTPPPVRSKNSPRVGRIGTRNMSPQQDVDQPVVEQPDESLDWGDPVVDEPEIDETPVAVPEPEPEPEPLPTEAAVDSVRARGLYRDTIRLRAAFPDIPPWLAIWGGRAIAGIQLAGAGLLLVGIFARLWSVGLTLVTGLLFYLTSWSIVKHVGLEPLPPESFTTLYCYLCLCVLSVGLVMTGAGTASIDGLIFNVGDDFGDDHII